MAVKSVNKELLIEAVRKMPCLYDTTKKEYKDELVRRANGRACVQRFLRKGIKLKRNSLKVIHFWFTLYTCFAFSKLALFHRS